MANVILDSGNRLQNGRRRILIRAGAAAVGHFKEGFRKGGFTDETLEKWAEPIRRQKKEDGSYAYKGFRGVSFTKADRRRAILVKTGRLRRSIQADKPGMSYVDIATDVPYAAANNAGDPSRNLPKRQFIGNSRQLNRKVQQIVKEEARRAILGNRR